MTGKLRSIQVLRAIAALLVVIDHAALWWRGAIGVDIFFVVSGFIMATIAPGRTAAQFLKARIRRVWPPYILAALPFIVLTIMHGGWTLRAALTDFTLWPLFSDQLQRPSLPQGWTLMWEFTFYLVVGAVLWSGRPKLALLAYALAMLAAATTSQPLITFTGSPLFLEFLAGAAIAKAPRIPSLGWLAIGAAVALFVLAPIPQSAWGSAQTIFWFHYSFDRVACWGILAALLVYGFVANEAVFRSRLFSPPVYLGDASYSIYLWHFLVKRLVDQWWPLNALLMVAFGIVMFRFVERPLLRCSRARRASQQAEPSTGPLAPAASP